jgi:hypothetical protein
VREDAYALFERLYAGTDRARFEADWAEKDYVILLHDPADGALRGFSTVRCWEVDTPAGGRATLVFSGDTGIDPAYWGQKVLQSAYAGLVLRRKLAAPWRPVCMFLISMHFKTYLMLANSLPRMIPRHDLPDDPVLGPLLDRAAGERFGAQYDPATRLVRWHGSLERVQEGLHPLTPEVLTLPHVRYFVARNPGHAEGDELACLAEVRLRDVARSAWRGVTRRRARR